MKPEVHPESAVSIHSELVDPFQAAGPKREWMEITQPQSGELDGLTVYVRLTLIDGELYVTEQGYRANPAVSLTHASARVRRELRLSGVKVIAEAVLPLMGEIGLPYLTAITSKRKRPGRAGTPLIELAEWARRRVEAQEKAPARGAIDYMRRRWPLDPPNRPAAMSARVNAAKDAGMLEKVEGRWQLTEKAIEELRNKQGEAGK